MTPEGDPSQRRGIDRGGRQDIISRSLQLKGRCSEELRRDLEHSNRRRVEHCPRFLSVIMGELFGSDAPVLQPVNPVFDLSSGGRRSLVPSEDHVWVKADGQAYSWWSDWLDDRDRTYASCKKPFRFHPITREDSRKSGKDLWMHTIAYTLL